MMATSKNVILYLGGVVLALSGLVLAGLIVMFN